MRKKIDSQMYRDSLFNIDSELVFHYTVMNMKVILRHKDLHAYGKICESVHKTASANKICKHKISFVKV